MTPNRLRPLRPTCADARGHQAAETAPPSVPWLVDQIARLAHALEQVSDVALRGGTAGDCAEVARRALEGETVTDTPNGHTA